MQHGRYPRPEAHVSQPCHQYNISIFQAIQDRCCTAGKCRSLMQALRHLSIMQAKAYMPVLGSSLKVSLGTHLKIQLACHSISCHLGIGCWSTSGCWSDSSCHLSLVALYVIMLSPMLKLKSNMLVVATSLPDLAACRCKWPPEAPLVNALPTQWIRRRAGKLCRFECILRVCTQLSRPQNAEVTGMAGGTC